MYLKIICMHIEHLLLHDSIYYTSIYICNIIYYDVIYIALYIALTYL